MLLRIGCLGLIAVVLLLGIVGAIASSQNEATPSAAGVVGTNPGDVHVRLKAGATGDVAPEGNRKKIYRFSILRINDNVVSTNEFEKPPAGMRWVGFEVQLENAGTEEIAAFLNWKLRDSDDFEHDITVILGSQPQFPVAQGNITPGAKIKGWIYFEIGSSARFKWLRADPNFILKNDLYFDAAP